MADPNPERRTSSAGALEARTAEFARVLLALDAAELDASVSRAVALVAELADADRCTLIVMPGSDWELRQRFEWQKPGLASPPPSPASDDWRRHRWAVAHLLRGEVVHIPERSALPAEATEERADLERRGVLSSLTLPIRRGGRITGFLVLESALRPRSWSRREIEWLHLASEILASAVERSHTERALQRRVEFEQQVAELSRRFLELRADDLETGIGLSLESALRLSDADRVYLVVIEPEPPFIQTAYERGRPGLAPFAPHIDQESSLRFRWSTKTILAGRTIRVDDPARLPDEAEAERIDMQQRGVSALLGIPVLSRGTVLGYLSFECLGRPRTWTDSEIGQYRLVAEILASGLRRQRAERELARQLLFEKRVATLSRRFLAVSPDAIGTAVVDALGEGAALAGADRALLVDLRTGHAASETFEWCADGVDPAPMPDLGWAIARVRDGRSLALPDLERLGPDEAEARRALEQRSVRSLLGIPLLSGDELTGLLFFETIRRPRWWSEQEIPLLRLLGELLSSALQRRRTETALRDSQVQLIQAQKMEAVGRLAGGIAHDFNNLLTVILGFSRALLSDLEDEHPAREDVSEIHAAAERAAALTRQLLTFSRRQHTQTRAVDLGDVATGLADMLRRLLGEDVELRIEAMHDDCWVEGDPHQLEQVIVNLAVNARDAMPDGGQLCVSVEPRDLDRAERSRLGLDPGMPYVVLSVEDSGVGLDDALRERIFEPFFTTKDPGKGTGLGLSIVYGIVQQAGGAISVLAAPGKGTTFEIFLPRIRADRVESGAHATPVPASRPGTVLLVEDEAAVRRLARRILESGGFRVLEARDGVDALDLVHSGGERIDLLLSDVVMPRMGGGELARRLRELHPELRVLFVSGYPQGAGDGAVPSDGRFLYKPFTARSLLHEVAAALEPQSDDPA